MRNMALAILALGLLIVGCTPPAPTGDVHNLGVSTAGAWSYLAGASGTVTISPGYSVLAVIVHATSASTVTITPSNSSVTEAGAGSSIPIPAGMTWEIKMPELATGVGGGSALRDNTVFVFSSTDSYFIALSGPGG